MSSSSTTFHRGPLMPFKPGDYVLGVDMETQGLNGQPYWAAFALYKIGEAWKPELVEEFEALCNPRRAKGYAVEEPDKFFESEIKEHLKDRKFTHRSSWAVDEAAWCFYEKTKEKCEKLGQKLHVVAQNPFPVETGSFSRSIFHKLRNVSQHSKRWNQAPYPFIDAATAILVADLQHGDYVRDKDLNPRHHPLADARHAALVLIECCKKVRDNAKSALQVQSQARVIRTQSRELQLKDQKIAQQDQEIDRLKAQLAESQVRSNQAERALHRERVSVINLSNQVTNLSKQVTYYHSFYQQHYPAISQAQTSSAL